MRLKILITLVFSTSCLISCQTLAERQGEWIYVGDETPNKLAVMVDCEQRANDDVNNDTYNDYYDSSNPYVGVIALFGAVTQQVGWQKSFDGCMNGREFARPEDADRARKEYQEFKDAREKRLRDDTSEVAK